MLTDSEGPSIPVADRLTVTPGCQHYLFNTAPVTVLSHHARSVRTCPDDDDEAVPRHR